MNAQQIRNTLNKKWHANSAQLHRFCLSALKKLTDERADWFQPINATITIINGSKTKRFVIVMIICPFPYFYWKFRFSRDRSNCFIIGRSLPSVCWFIYLFSFSSHRMIWYLSSGPDPTGSADESIDFHWECIQLKSKTTLGPCGQHKSAVNYVTARYVRLWRSPNWRNEYATCKWG